MDDDQKAPDEAWARCVTAGCGFEMVSAYADGDDHTEVGIVAGAASLHLEAHPEHDVEYGRDSGESAAVWQEMVAQRERDEAEQRAEDIRETRERTAARVNRVLNQSPVGSRRTRAGGPIMLGGKLQ